jgi:hypothetical protein
MPRRRRAAALPALIEQKLTKTGYTRGASTREIYQNRVTRSNPVLVPLEDWDKCGDPDDGSDGYEGGSIALVEPSWYFTTEAPDGALAADGLELGVNALLLYRKRSDWENHRPAGATLANGKPFVPATNRTSPLGGVYFARVHGTVADDGLQVTEGFDTNHLRGAGIRVYEYASTQTIKDARLQLESLVWFCHDAVEGMVRAGMTAEEAKARREETLADAEARGLLDMERLRKLRMVDDEGHTTCPLCLKRLSVDQFLLRTEQAEGRATYDLTTTEVSLFHIQELRVGTLQHRPYNLGWGHHFCNVVTKDAGIINTLKWMEGVLANQPHAVEEEAALVEEAGPE